MSVWQFTAAIGGFIKANAAPDEQALSSDEAKALADFVDQAPVWH